MTGVERATTVWPDYVTDLLLGTLDPLRFGWKAHYLGVLHSEGIATPGGVALGVNAPMDDQLLSLADMILDCFRSEPCLAVRSSGRNEDSETDSQAGKNVTVFVEPSRDALVKAIREVALHDPLERVGVIIQPFVVGSFAGVAFSANPVNYDRNELVVEWVKGAGESLVSGRMDSTRLMVPLRGPISYAPDWPMEMRSLEQLRRFLLKLEISQSAPVDVEWVATPHNQIILVQVRPIVLPVEGVYALNDVKDFAELPGIVASHPKLALRRTAAELGVPMGSAMVVTRSLPDVPLACDASTLDRHVAAKSVVLLHPRKVDSHVVREFGALHGGDVEFFTSGCRRYAVREYPRGESFTESVQRVLAIGADVNWVPIAIVQDVLCADATGIARRVGDETVIEIAQGHFVPKGTVETCLFSCHPDHVETLAVQKQSRAYHFLNGHVISEEPLVYHVDYSDSLIALISRTLAPLFDRHAAATVEFGAIVRGDGPLVYLIDWAEGDSADTVPDPGDMGAGIISSGMAQGQVVVVTPPATSSQLDSHLDDDLRSGDESEVPAIYLCDRPSSDLLDTARAACPGSGFVFRHSSMLCHMAVVLRERGLAAITVDQAQWDEARQWPGACLNADAHGVDLKRAVLEP